MRVMAEYTQKGVQGDIYFWACLKGHRGPDFQPLEGELQ